MISIVVPVYQEAENIEPFLRDVERQVQEAHETLVVYDFPEDTTLAAIHRMSIPCPDLRLIQNTLGRGVLNALKVGFKASQGDVVVVMMADRSDDAKDVGRMANLIRKGADVVAGSRYMDGGRQEGGALVKRILSRVAGKSLFLLRALPIRDATNNFRAYSRRIIDEIPIEGRVSFALALELTLKAHWRGWKVAEVPTIWRDRSAGRSRFRLLAWLPHYLRWYLAALWKVCLDMACR